MKKKIRNLLVFLISGMVLLFLLINYVVQVILTQQSIVDESEIVFQQVQRLIEVTRPQTVSNEWKRCFLSAQ